MRAAWVLLCATYAVATTDTAPQCRDQPSVVDDAVFRARVVISDEVMGARAAVAGDLNDDGRPDIVTASSTDNTIAVFFNEGNRTFSRKRALTYEAKGARMVALGDVDGDGALDVVFGAYYDNTVGWFRNDGKGDFEAESKARRKAGLPEWRVVSASADEVQGVVAADLDGDGDLDVASASSGDHSIAWFENMGGGRFCEVKRVVDDDAIGARTVAAGDLDGDGKVDLASASKDDDTIAVYLQGEAFSKRVVNASAAGAYSLVVVDVDRDGDADLVTASNGDDTVAWYENDGTGTAWTFHEIYAGADFVLSVAAADFDLDGDVDVASASFFDGGVRWYENLGGAQTWAPHDLRVVAGTQGHYVWAGDVDGDGDDDLVASTHAENTAAVYYASTCDGPPSDKCCAAGWRWDGARCVSCDAGDYGSERGVCEPCPDACAIPGFTQTPAACLGITGCAPSFEACLAECTCGADAYLDDATDTCAPCPDGQRKAEPAPRDEATYESEGRDWAGFSEEGCVVGSDPKGKRSDLNGDRERILLITLCVILTFTAAVCLVYGLQRAWLWFASMREGARLHELDLGRRLLKALATPSECRYTVCFLSYDDFRACGKLKSHEKLRRKLVHLDDRDDIVAFCERVPTCFVSHQWLGLTHPDPTGVHFEAILEACDALCERYDVDPRRLYLWVDYVSVPQKNKVLQQLSIGSITVYASVCRYFLVVAPATTNADTGVKCDSSTYQRRGWCRLEQFARIASGGLREMCLWEDGRLAPIKDNARWYQDSCEVFQADFTFESDKGRIVETFLGLYGILLVNKNEGDNAMILGLIEARRELVFPANYFHDLPRRLEREIAIIQSDGDVEEQPTAQSTRSVSFHSSTEEINSETSLMRSRVNSLRTFSMRSVHMSEEALKSLHSMTSALSATKSLRARVEMVEPALGDGEATPVYGHGMRRPA